MILYEEWLQKAADAGLRVIEDVPFESGSKGLIYGNRIGLSNRLKTTAEKTCTLAEEVIHSKVNVGNILDQRNVCSTKQEYVARKILRHELASLQSIVNLLKQGYRQSHEIAEKLEITEEFLHAAIDGYRKKYGLYVRVGNDTLLLEPTVALLSQIQ